MIRRFLLICLLLITISPTFAVDDPRELLPDPTQERMAEKIDAELRCLVCQNESIEDSSASLARDLRRVVRQQVAQGKNRDDILAWMTSRYGDFVRLKPRLTAATALLWLTPFVALALGLFLASRIFRHRKETTPLTEEERARLEILLQSRAPTDHGGGEA
ncbi:cytochrome c-type biogenesis protein CcmH [Candidatus Kirkpatrickella diaphorinae]|uniref:Cytochrome c-type biogenesis protein n=1 Tax=Candidatus Kirkpatrickella diaphorinae TaxID=2984322 RepID=A0ABY6GH40_9PROT|nr:cytochrome c-type biogenesis protein [Candidatus Kirkpatrickella diaphorinae]UYH50607.1 cytochrome c-type biogenesis protein CcmH [Candidatus Kirkpatrickella diaphorinae]